MTKKNDKKNAKNEKNYGNELLDIIDMEVGESKIKANTSAQFERIISLDNDDSVVALLSSKKMDKIKHWIEWTGGLEVAGIEHLTFPKSVSADEFIKNMKLKEYFCSSYGLMDNCFEGLRGISEGSYKGRDYRAVIEIEVMGGEGSKRNVRFTFFGHNVHDYIAVVSGYLKKHIRKHVENVIPVNFYYLDNGQVKSTTKSIKVNEKFSTLLYPTIDGGSIFEGYIADSSPILIITGQPGTGKSVLTKLIVDNLINNRIARMNDASSYDEDGDDEDNIYYVKDSGISENDKFWLDILRNNPPAVVFDDLDYQLRDRKEGNIFMDKLVSLSDGFVSIGDTKIIITTNFGALKMDEALMRPGRLYDHIELRPLTVSEVAAVLVDYKTEHKIFYEYLKNNVNGNKNEKSELTLADIFEVFKGLELQKKGNKLYRKCKQDVKKQDGVVGFKK